MDVWMMFHGLSPCVQDAEEADIGSEMPGVSRHLEHRIGTGLIEQVVNESLVAEGQCRELVGVKTTWK